MMSLLQVIDRAGGYAFGTAEGANDTIWQVAVREGMGTMDIKDVQERWLDAKDDWDQHETRNLEEEAKARNEAAAETAEAEDFDMNLDMDIPGNSGIKVIRK